MFDLDNLRMIASNPLIAILMAFVGLMCAMLIITLVELLFSKIFGLEVKRLQIVGFKFERDKSGELKYEGYKVSLFSSVQAGINPKKYAEMDQEKCASIDMAFSWISISVAFLISAGISVVCVLSALKMEHILPASIVFHLGCWILIVAIIMTVMVIRSLIIFSSKDSLYAYYHRALKLLNDGVPFATLELKPVSELAFKKATNMEKATYFVLYFEYLDACEMYDRMPQAVSEAENLLKPTTTSQSEKFVCMLLTYYYSRHCIVPSKAKTYYHRVEDMWKKDNDSNTMMIKGFYELNCFGMVENAETCVRKALETIDTFPASEAERVYVRKQIAYLNRDIDNLKQSYAGKSV